MKLAVPDLISNSYFPAVAAVELGFFKEEGLDVSLELIFPVDKAYRGAARRRRSILSAARRIRCWPPSRMAGRQAALRAGAGHVLVSGDARQISALGAAMSASSRAAASARHRGSKWASAGC